MSDWSAKNPYMTEITENYILNGEGSRKGAPHRFRAWRFRSRLQGRRRSGRDCREPPHIVEELLEVQGWDRDASVITHNGERSLYDALKKDFEVHMANKKFVQSLAEKVVSTGMKISMSIVARTRNDAAWSASEDQHVPPTLRPSVPSDDPAAQVEAITADAKAIEDYLWTRDYVDIMREFDVKYTPEEFLELADRLKPRLYSIASSHDAHPGLVELTVGIVRFEYNGRARVGCAPSSWPTRSTPPALPSACLCLDQILHPPRGQGHGHHHGRPRNRHCAVRAFMEQRVHDGGSGKNWLFFGDQSEKTEFYYKDEIESWIDEGHLWRFTTAWSRDQEEKIYVQHRLKEHGAEVWEWFERGAYFYICGDKQYMAKDVHRALIDIAIEHGGMSEDDATHFIEKTMMREEALPTRRLLSGSYAVDPPQATALLID